MLCINNFLVNKLNKSTLFYLNFGHKNALKATYKKFPLPFPWILEFWLFNWEILLSMLSLQETIKPCKSFIKENIGNFI